MLMASNCMLMASECILIASLIRCRIRPWRSLRGRLASVTAACARRCSPSCARTMRSSRSSRPKSAGSSRSVSCSLIARLVPASRSSLGMRRRSSTCTSKRRSATARTPRSSSAPSMATRRCSRRAADRYTSRLARIAPHPPRMQVLTAAPPLLPPDRELAPRLAA